MKTLQIGQMPGKIESYAVEAGTTYAQALTLAGLEVGNNEVKADSVAVTDLNAVIGEGVNTILLTAKVKGNAGTVQIGQMPGKIETYAIEDGTTFAQALALAGLEVGNNEVKADSVAITDLNQVVGSGVNTILLTAKVKGNAKTIQIGQMPGKIETYAVEDGTTYRQALALAGLDVGNNEVKADSVAITDLDHIVGPTVNTILLTAKVKGNN